MSPFAFGQDGVVGGVPRHFQTFGDPGHGEVLDHDPFQRPPQPSPRQLRPGFGRRGGVLTPHMPAPRAPVAADRDMKDGGSPSQREVRQPADHRAHRDTWAAAPPTPVIGLDNPARQDRTLRLHELAGDFQTEAVHTAEGSEIRHGEGSVRHVEVFQTGCVGTPIIGRPRRLPRDRHADNPHPTPTPSIVKSRFDCC